MMKRNRSKKKVERQWKEIEVKKMKRKRRKTIERLNDINKELKNKKDDRKKPQKRRKTKSQGKTEKTKNRKKTIREEEKKDGRANLKYLKMANFMDFVIRAVNSLQFCYIYVSFLILFILNLLLFSKYSSRCFFSHFLFKL